LNQHGDSRAPSGHLFFLIDFPGVKTPGFMNWPLQGLHLMHLTLITFCWFSL